MARHSSSRRSQCRKWRVSCITCQSTRTHNSRRRLRRSCWWSGHLHVIWHSTRIKRAMKSHACPSSLFRGASHPLGWSTAALGLRRSSHVSRSDLPKLWVGVPAGLRQSGAMPPFTFEHRGNAGTAAYNWSVNTDAQMRPLPSVAPVFVRRLPPRYMALASHA